MSHKPTANAKSRQKVSWRANLQKRPFPKVGAVSQGSAKNLRQMRRRNRLVFTAAVVLVAGVMSVVAWMMFISDYFTIQAVEVRGIEEFDAALIAQAADVAPGTSQFFLDTAQVVQRVAGLREVDSVALERAWPQGLVITITERKPAIQIPYGSSFWIADAKGVVFESATTTNTKLATVQADPQQSRVLAAAWTLWKDLSPEFAKQVKVINANSYDSITLDFGKNIKVLMGGPEDVQLKSQVAKVLLDDGAKDIDVSAPDRPVRR